LKSGTFRSLTFKFLSLYFFFFEYFEYPLTFTNKKSLKTKTHQTNNGIEEEIFLKKGKRTE